MATIAGGPLGGEIRGSVGDSCFSRNRGGLYVKARVGPTWEVTKYVTLVRDSAITVGSAWSTGLSGGQLEGWCALAARYPVVNRVGQVVTRCGSSFFFEANVRLVLASLPVVLDPPATWEVTEPGQVLASGVVNVGDPIVSVDVAAGLAEGEGLWIWASELLRVSRQPRVRMLKVMNLEPRALYSNPCAFSGDWTARWGTGGALPGDRIGLRVSVLQGLSGCCSLPVSVQVTLEAGP